MFRARRILPGVYLSPRGIRVRIGARGPARTWLSIGRWFRW